MSISNPFPPISSFGGGGIALGSSFVIDGINIAFPFESKYPFSLPACCVIL